LHIKRSGGGGFNRDRGQKEGGESVANLNLRRGNFPVEGGADAAWPKREGGGGGRRNVAFCMQSNQKKEREEISAGRAPSEKLSRQGGGGEVPIEAEEELDVPSCLRGGILLCRRMAWPKIGKKVRTFKGGELPRDSNIRGREEKEYLSLGNLQQG